MAVRLVSLLLVFHQTMASVAWKQVMQESVLVLLRVLEFPEVALQVSLVVETWESLLQVGLLVMQALPTVLLLGSSMQNGMLRELLAALLLESLVVPMLEYLGSTCAMWEVGQLVFLAALWLGFLVVAHLAFLVASFGKPVRGFPVAPGKSLVSLAALPPVSVAWHLLHQDPLVS